MSLPNLPSRSAICDTVPPKSLHDFQTQFGQYLRGDKAHINQKGGFNSKHFKSNVVCDYALNIKTSSLHNQNRVTRLYQNLVFDNVCGFVNKCFPVCKSLLTHDKWRHVCQEFFATHPCNSPYFTQINQSFVDYLVSSDTLIHLDLPPYFGELAHYEWMELYVDIHRDSDALSVSKAYESTAKYYYLKLNPTLQSLHYQWPVHTINIDNLPETPEDSFFLIYRHPNLNEVKFMQINVLTYALIAFMGSHGDTFMMPVQLEDSIRQFAHSIGFKNAQSLVEFGASIIEQLQQQCVFYKEESG